MSTVEKYFINQFKSHKCQLPTSEDLNQVKQVKKVQNFFLISLASLRGYLKMGDLTTIYREKLRQLRTTSILVIHPFSPCMRFLHFYLTFFLLFSLFFFPFFSAFHGPFYARSLRRFEKSFDDFYCVLIAMGFFQAACVLEIGVTFLMGYEVPSTQEIVIHPMGIAKHYLSTYFFPDLLSTVPADALLVGIMGNKVYGELPRLPTICLNLLPLLRIVRMKSLLFHFRQVFEYFSSSYHIYNLVVALLLGLYMIQWGACLLVMIPRWIFFDELLVLHSRNSCHHSWLMEEGLIHKGIYSQYLDATLRSATGLLHIGFNTSRIEKLEEKGLMLLIGITGVIYRVIILVMLSQMLSMWMTGRTLYLEMMDQVQHYMQVKRFPQDLKKKVLANYIYLFQKEYTEERNILRLLSDNVRREILLKLRQGLIRKVYLFSGLSQTLVFDIVTCLKPEIYLEGDVVYKAEEVGNCMYFISFGTVAVYSKKGVETGHLDDGNHFGEVSLILQVRRSETVVAIEPTQLFTLNSHDFAGLIKSYPTVYSKLEKMASEKYHLFFEKEDEDDEDKKDGTSDLD